MMFGAKKTRMNRITRRCKVVYDIWLRYVKNDVIIAILTQLKSVTDGRTNGGTDRQNSYNIYRVCINAYNTLRDKIWTQTATELLLTNIAMLYGTNSWNDGRDYNVLPHTAAVAAAGATASVSSLQNRAPVFLYTCHVRYAAGSALPLD